MNKNCAVYHWMRKSKWLKDNTTKPKWVPIKKRNDRINERKSKSRRDREREGERVEGSPSVEYVCQCKAHVQVQWMCIWPDDAEAMYIYRNNDTNETHQIHLKAKPSPSDRQLIIKCSFVVCVKEGILRQEKRQKLERHINRQNEKIKTKQPQQRRNKRGKTRNTRLMWTCADKSTLCKVQNKRTRPPATSQKWKSTLRVFNATNAVHRIYRAKMSTRNKTN